MGRKEQNKFYHDYIIDAIDPDGYDVNPKGNKAKLQFLRDTFRDEYGWAIQRMGEQRAMAEWLSGLPSAISLPFYNNDIIELAKKSGSLPMNATDAQEGRVLDNYWNFMANKIMQLFRKYKVN